MCTDNEKELIEYRAYLVEQACNLLSAMQAHVERGRIEGYEVYQAPIHEEIWESDVTDVAVRAVTKSWEKQPDASFRFRYSEAEALLRCGWRPNWYARVG